MKNSMKRRLQIRFVCIAVSAIVILQMLIVGFSISRSYLQMTIRADKLIMLISRVPDSPELKNADYFRAIYSLADKKIDTELTHTLSVTQAEALAYAKDVIEQKTEKGYADTYRYLVHRTKDTIYVTFLSRETAVEAFIDNAKTILLVSLIGIAVMTVFLIFLSGIVVTPLIKNHQKQKEFITSASHELKTPLTVISADAQLLETEIGENEWLLDIMKQTKYMTEMTQRLVYLAKMEEQDNQLTKIVFPISDVVEDIAESYKALARNAGKKYEVMIQKNLSYCGDEKAICELVHVLLDNAFKYSTEDGKIIMTLGAKGREIVCSVENEVEKIDTTQLEKFSERFYRVDTSDRIKGYGIGLSIAKAVAEQHKGRLTIERLDDCIIKISAVLK